MFKEKYKKEAVPEMMEEFGLENEMAVPEIEKVIINSGVGKKIQEMTRKEREEHLQSVKREIASITGQEPAVTKARGSISGFELQKGDVSGVKATLRGERMYDFLERLILIALPRSKDFRGLKRESVDKAGNLTLGIEDHTIFPEAEVEGVKDSFGLEATLKTGTQSREMSLRLFELLDFPLRKKEE